MSSLRRAPGEVVVLAVISYAVLQWQGRTSGSTYAERRAVLPGDDLLRRPQVSITHAVTVPVQPSRVWPWLVQMGWGRAGWYTPRWVDRLLFPANGPSADRILPGLQRLSAGDVIPDGPAESECSFTVVDLVPERRLVLRSTSHLPLSWRRPGELTCSWSGRTGW